jgi:hypothetical protein
MNELTMWQRIFELIDADELEPARIAEVVVGEMSEDERSMYLIIDMCSDVSNAYTLTDRQRTDILRRAAGTPDWSTIFDKP